MTHWYQKEYTNKELRRAFSNVSSWFPMETLKNALSKLGPYTADNIVLDDILQKLCLQIIVASEATLFIGKKNFILTETIGGNKTVLECKKMENGWRFCVVTAETDATKIGERFGWQRLSNEHPLAGTTHIGPSRHLNFYHSTMEA